MEPPTPRWVLVDLHQLNYEPWNEQPWHDSVPWDQVMEALELYVVPGADVDFSILDRVIAGLPLLVQEGVWSLFREPLGIQPDGHPIGGGHRMLAMKRQGLNYAYGME